mgnify:CR=1 FL=1
MLRTIFGEPRKIEEGILLETNSAIQAFSKQLRAVHGNSQVEAKWIRLDLWASGLLVALDELEQSVYCSAKLAEQVKSRYEDEMSEEERNDYYRHVYYYKNAFIRLFSILDKTGFFLDTLFDLDTSKVKPKFSYFTVLRQMHLTSTHKKLEQKLFDLKVKHRQPLDRLRRKRNLEIHSMNAELIDDFWRTKSRFADRMQIESLEANMADLQAGYEMVCCSLHTIFRYSKGTIQ